MPSVAYGKGTKCGEIRAELRRNRALGAQATIDKYAVNGVGGGSIALHCNMLPRIFAEVHPRFQSFRRRAAILLIALEQGYRAGFQQIHTEERLGVAAESEKAALILAVINIKPAGAHPGHNGPGASARPQFGGQLRLNNGGGRAIQLGGLVD